MALPYRPRSDMIKALEMESALKSPARIPFRKGANFFQECLAPLSRFRNGDETTPGLSKICEEPGCEDGFNSKQYWRKMVQALGTVSGCQGNVKMKFKRNNHKQLGHDPFCFNPD